MWRDIWLGTGGGLAAASVVIAFIAPGMAEARTSPREQPPARLLDPTNPFSPLAMRGVHIEAEIPPGALPAPPRAIDTRNPFTETRAEPPPIAKPQPPSIDGVNPYRRSVDWVNPYGPTAPSPAARVLDPNPYQH